MRLAGIGALAGAAVAVPTHAQEFEFAEERGGWTIVAADKACSMSMEFEGPGATDFALIRDVEDDRIIVAVTNINWSATKGHEYDVSLFIDREGYGGGKAIGYVSGIRRGFLTAVAKSFEASFAQGDTLYIFLGDQEIDRLSLDGTAVAVESLNRCVRKKAATLAAAKREKERFDHLPKDPFAAPAPAPGEPVPPKEINLQQWAQRTQWNFPPEARRAGLSGKVTVRLTIGTIGRAESCEILQSSGHAILDEAACSSSMRYARFEPARDAQGNATTGTVDKTINYFGE